MRWQGDAEEFSDLVREDLLVWFCRHYGFPTHGFSRDAVQRVSRHDAKWLLNALTTQAGARTAGAPGPLTIWIEPVVAIEAAWRLHARFGWPKQLVELQSRERWPFAFLAYSHPHRTRIAVEVTKSDQEIDCVIEEMSTALSQWPLDVDPSQGEQRDAYRKAIALRQTGAPLVWILGPSGDGRVLRVEYADDCGAGRLENAEIGELLYREGVN